MTETPTDAPHPRGIRPADQAGRPASAPDEPHGHERTRERVLASLLSCPEARTSGRPCGLGHVRE